MYSYRVIKWLDLTAVRFSKVSPFKKGVSKKASMEVAVVMGHEIRTK